MPYQAKASLMARGLKKSSAVSAEAKNKKVYKHEKAD
jgi:hypothetical protein